MIRLADQLVGLPIFMVFPLVETGLPLFRPFSAARLIKIDVMFIATILIGSEV